MLADLVGSIAHPPRDDRGVRFAVVPRNQLGVRDVEDRDRARRRVVAAADKQRADCEDWCLPPGNHTASMAHCKLCKCRACSACYTRAWPKWATANPRAVLASCELFGGGICNRTGNFSATLAATTAAWNYNHTSQWIADVFTASYAREAAGFKALTVASDVGLTATELAGIGMSKDEVAADGLGT